MKRYEIYITGEDRIIYAEPGSSLLSALTAGGRYPEAPCGGKGTCGKCQVIADGRRVLACRTVIEHNMAVTVPERQKTRILEHGMGKTVRPDGLDDYVLAFDVGTTTVVGCLLDGHTGKELACSSEMNPQIAYGADVISRLQFAADTGSSVPGQVLRRVLFDLTLRLSGLAGIDSRQISRVSVVGNTAMHHLMLGIDPGPLLTPPYMPAVTEALEIRAKDWLPVGEDSVLCVLPNIAGFVGADTTGCMAALQLDMVDELTLLIDIGTNGEMVLCSKERRIACSTAAGPAFEGARIHMGMRGAPGAVDHVWLENGSVRWHTIGETAPVGLCGSGLLDLVAVLLKIKIIDARGRMQCGSWRLGDTEVILTQKDVREVQLAKAAICAGIESLAEQMHADIQAIQKVYLAGAFGNYLNPSSACAIGMIPPVLLECIQSVGNAAGEGAKICALSRESFKYSQKLAKDTEFLELAGLLEFQKRYVAALNFPERKDSSVNITNV